MQKNKNNPTTPKTNTDTVDQFDAGKYFDHQHDNRPHESLSEEEKKTWWQRDNFGQPTPRNKNKEIRIWNKHIRPIVEKHHICEISELFKYKYFPRPETIDVKGIYLMQRKIMTLCMKIDLPKDGIPDGQPSDLFDGWDDFFRGVMGQLHSANSRQTEIDSNGGIPRDLVKIFRLFLVDIFEKETLPYFLELLSMEDEYNRKAVIESPEADIKNRLKQTDELATTNESQYPNEDDLLYKIGDTAERLYLNMVNQLKNKGKNLTNATKENLKQSALNVFDSNPNSFLPLLRMDIQGDSLYSPAEKQKRQIVGMIIRSALLRLTSLKVPDYQTVYNRYLKLKELKAKTMPIPQNSPSVALK